jgi:hypothetical protein
MGTSIPKVILNFFNAVYLEIESRIINKGKTIDTDEKKAEKERVHEVI